MRSLIRHGAVVAALASAACSSSSTEPAAGSTPTTPACTDCVVPDGGGGEQTSQPLGTLVGTVTTSAIDIPPGEEYFRCQDFENPFGRDVAVLSTESFMTAGSHHMFVFLKDGATNGELEPCSGLEFGSNLHLAQRSQEKFTYPPGVGRFYPKTQGLRVQIHYLNPTKDTVHAEISVTIRADVPEAVPIHSSQIFMNTLGIGVPPLSKGTAHVQCGVPTDANVFLAASHMHQHGVHFISRASDGQLLYETNQWAEPNPWYFDAPRKLKAGSTIQVTCDYENDTDQALSFGESAATNEMCIFTAAYYPAKDGESITCLF